LKSNRIRETRYRLGLSSHYVAGRLEIPVDALRRLEIGKRKVSAEELYTLSRIFGEPMPHLLGK
jgi:transcriptional regulator with XRE-family HTH domain